LPFVLLFAIVLIVLTMLLAAGARQQYLDRLEEDLAGQASIAGASVGSALALGTPPTGIQSLIATMSVGLSARITIVGADGSVLADTDNEPDAMENHANRPEVVEALAAGRGTDTRKSTTLNIEFMYVAVPIPQEEGAVARVAMPLDNVQSAVRAIWTWGAIAAAGAITMVVAIAWFIAGRIVKPLEDLRMQAHAVAAGDLSARVEPSPPQEFAEVGYAFNRMTEELEASHDALSQARHRLEVVLAELTDGVVITDDEGLVLRMNAAAEHLLDAREAPSIGRPFVQVCRDHELQALLKQALEGRQHSEAAVEHGLNRRTLLTTAQVVDDDQERLGLVVLRDITELRRLETVRREFVANVSHELRTPLTSIRAMVETLEAGAVEDSALASDFLARIVGEVDRLNALVEDLLDLARLEAGRTTLDYDVVDPVSLARVSGERLRSQIERAQLTLDIDAAGEIVPVHLDPKRMEQVLINLIHNAIKFTSPGGHIRIGVRQDGKTTVIDVQDTGVGIPAAEQARLFERFYKSDKARRSDGTGLGLAIVKHIVQAHGGTISVESAVGEGTTFQIVLPGKRLPKSRQRA
jgi:two-component system phosphate regulon sensor histidine kinase PhoR